MPEFNDGTKINNFTQMNNLKEKLNKNKKLSEDYSELQSGLGGELSDDDFLNFPSKQAFSDIETETTSSPNGDIVTRKFNYKDKTVTETFKDKFGNIKNVVYDNPNNQKHYHYSEMNKSYYSYIKQENIKYNDGYTINKNFNSGKLQNVSISFKKGEDNICIDFDKITEKELNIIKSRDLILQKDCNKKNFSAKQLLQMAKLNDYQWAKVIKREILKTVDSQKDNFSFYFLEELASISDKDWGNIEKYSLLSFRRDNGKKLFVNEIKELAKIPKEVWENMQSRNILNLKDDNGDYFFINKNIVLSSLNNEEWDNLEKRELLSLKYPDGTWLHSNEIKILANISQEAWDNIKKRNLFNIKDSFGNKFYIQEIQVLAELTPREWRYAENRELLKDRSNFGYIKVFAGLDNEKWETVKKSSLFDLNSSYGKYFSEGEVKLLTNLDEKYWENIEKRNLLKQDSLTSKDIIAAAKLNDKDYGRLKIELKKVENRGVPFFYIYEKIKNQKPKTGSISLKGKQEKTYSSVLSVLKGEDYNKINKELYGEKTAETENLFKEFNKKYPNIVLTADNDISEKEARDLIQATEEFLELQKKGNAPFVKHICFTKLDGMRGFYKHKTIFINLLPPDRYEELDKDSFLEILIHENGHHKDYMDKKYKEIPVPKEIKDILKKIFRDYALKNPSESIAVLTEAIEMPDDKDGNPLTNKIRLRKDKKGNYILMISKDTNLSKEETDKLGIYFRSIRCPELIPDYDEDKHGKPTNYYETIIRKQ